MRTKKIKLENGQEFPVNGKYIMLFPISELAKAVERTTQSIRKWEKNKIIPKPVFLDKANRRLYSEEQIMLIVKVAQSENIRQGESLENSNFTKRVFDSWKTVTKQTLSGGRPIEPVKSTNAG